MSLFRAMLTKLGLNRTKPDEEDGADIDIAEPSPFSALTSEHDHQPTTASLPPGLIAEPDTFVFQPGQMPRSTLGLYYPEDGVFLIRHPDENRTGVIVQFGGGDPGLIPLSGDWNGDGIHGIGLYDPKSGFYFLRNSTRGGKPDYEFVFGEWGKGWIPLVGDWDGDGVYTAGVYNPTDGGFHISNSLDTATTDAAFHFGPPNEGCLPIAGDWCGTGQFSVGIYNPKTGVFRLRTGLVGENQDIVFQFGPRDSGMVPIAGDWDGTGIHSVGLYDPEEMMVHFRSTNAGGERKSFSFGPNNRKALPLSFVWV